MKLEYLIESTLLKEIKNCVNMTYLLMRLVIYININENTTIRNEKKAMVTEYKKTY